MIRMALHSVPNDRGRRGVALLMVLFIVLAVTVIAAGFIARTDVELACGQNMLMEVQLKHLAESGLEHARGILTRPQGAESSLPWTWNWQQLLAGSPDYYDVSVALDTSDSTDRCLYNVSCEAYHLQNGRKAGSYGLSAAIRLNPAIGLWTKTDTTLRPNWVLHGDMLTQGNVINQAVAASLDGDVFANQLTGACVGQTRPYADVSLAWPPVTSSYTKILLSRREITSSPLSSSPGEVRIWWRGGDGHLTLGGNVTVQGMLLVPGDLTVTGSGSTITAAPNAPALYVGGNLILEDANNFKVDGLAIVNGNLRLRGGAYNVKFTGGLCLAGTVRETASDASGCGNQLQLVGNPRWTAGALDNALDLSVLDGVADYAQTSDSSTQLQLAGQYTLSLWMKAAATQNDNAAVMVRCSSDGLATHWGLQFNTGDSKVLIVRHLGDGGNAWSTGITLAEIRDAWHHVAVTWNGTTMTSYLDGAQRASGAWSYALGSGLGHLNLGAQGIPAVTTLYSGAIDDVRVYSRAWTAVEIGQIRAGQSLTYVLGHWRFNEAGSSVTILADPVRASIVAPAGCWSPATDAFVRSVARKLP